MKKIIDWFKSKFGFLGKKKGCDSDSPKSGSCATGACPDPSKPKVTLADSE